MKILEKLTLEKLLKTYQESTFSYFKDTEKRLVDVKDDELIYETCGEDELLKLKKEQTEFEELSDTLYKRLLATFKTPASLYRGCERKGFAFMCECDKESFEFSKQVCEAAMKKGDLKLLYAFAQMFSFWVTRYYVEVITKIAATILPSLTIASGEDYKKEWLPKFRFVAYSPIRDKLEEKYDTSLETLKYLKISKLDETT